MEIAAGHQLVLSFGFVIFTVVIVYEAVAEENQKKAHGAMQLRQTVVLLPFGGHEGKCKKVCCYSVTYDSAVVTTLCKQALS